MSLILRIDVDKAYGRSNFLKKIMSKIREDAWFPVLRSYYLKDLKYFLEYINENKISGIFYHRLCTLPDEEILASYKENGHVLGLHAENTMSFATFEEELNVFSSKVGIFPHSFTKHGSGDQKLGKNHYAPYEPEKYLAWSKKVDVPFLFGNGCIESNSCKKDNFFDAMFWLHPAYRKKNADTIEWVVNLSKERDVVVLIHPSNFIANEVVRNDFMKIVRLSKENDIAWRVD